MEKFNTININDIATVRNGDWEKYKSDTVGCVTNDSGLYFQEAVTNVTDTMITLAYQGDFDLTGNKIKTGEPYEDLIIVKINKQVTFDELYGHLNYR